MEKERKINKGIMAIGIGAIATGALLVGFELGEKYTFRGMMDTFIYLCKQDPTLEPHMWNCVKAARKDIDWEND